MNKDTFSIFVVDDEVAIVNIVSRLLSNAGFNCETFSDSLEASERLRQQKVDLVISDIKMPKLSGVELAEIINRETPSTKVILMTGYAEYACVSEAIKHRPIAYLEKPLTPDDLIRHVNAAYNDSVESSRQEQYRASLEQAAERWRQDLAFANESIAAEKRITQGIVSNATFGMVAVDDFGMVHLMNSSFADLLGLQNTQSTSYVGCLLEDILSGDEQSRFLELAHEVRRTKESRERELALAEKHVKVTAYPLLCQDRMSAIMFIVQDITEQERLKQESVQNATLISIGQLAARVIGEVNNSLGALAGNHEMLSTRINTLLKYLSALESHYISRGGSEILASMKKTHGMEGVAQDLGVQLAEAQTCLRLLAKMAGEFESFAQAGSGDTETPKS